MKWEKADVRAGLMVLGALGIAVAATVWLRRSTGTGDVFFAEFDKLEGIGVQAPVVMQGYTIGRVEKVELRTAADGRMRFRVSLKIDDVANEGVKVSPIVVGTTAHVQPPAVIGAPTIVLEAPARGGPRLTPGATLPTVQGGAMLDLVQRLISETSGDVKKALARTVVLLDSLQSTLVVVRQVAEHSVAVADSAGIALPRMARSAEVAMANANHAIVRADSMLQEFRVLAPGAKALLDSLQGVIAEAKTASKLAVGTMKDADPQVKKILANLDSVSVTVKVLSRELSRKPLKFFTGVKDSTP